MLPVTGDVACYMSYYQLQVMLPVTCHVTSYRLCCLLHVMLPVTGDVACYTSCYQLQVMLPVTCHVTSNRLCCLLHVMLLVPGLVACYRSCCQLMCDETPCHVKIQTMHEIFILGGGSRLNF